jgi:hypothetical protein
LPRERKRVEAALEAKGFVRSEGDHHYLVYHTPDGLKSRARTKRSHTPKMKDVPDNLLGQMARQCRLSKREFLRLVDCPMGREEYEDRLRDQGEFREEEGSAEVP